jgi:glutathione-regulated potassium-efflux system ancillary protein KefG
LVDLDDLVDAAGVAEILGLSRVNGVFVYQARYAEMPKPVLDLGNRRVKLWSRKQMTAWQAKRGK